MRKSYPVRKGCLVIVVREVKKVKEVKRNVFCDISPVAIFSGMISSKLYLWLLKAGWNNHQVQTNFPKFLPFGDNPILKMWIWGSFYVTLSDYQLHSRKSHGVQTKKGLSDQYFLSIPICRIQYRFVRADFLELVGSIYFIYTHSKAKLHQCLFYLQTQITKSVFLR